MNLVKIISIALLFSIQFACVEKSENPPSEESIPKQVVQDDELKLVNAKIEIVNKQINDYFQELTELADSGLVDVSRRGDLIIAYQNAKKNGDQTLAIQLKQQLEMNFKYGDRYDKIIRDVEIHRDVLKALEEKRDSLNFRVRTK